MEQVRVERLEHWGLMASVRKDLGLLDRMDRRLMPDEQERSTPGDAGAGMILHGLGFAHRPFALTPQLFAHTPRALLWRPGIEAERCNRGPLGRPLADASASGCDRLWQALARARCAHEGSERRFQQRDTTRGALTGTSVPASAAHTMRLTPGSSQEHRPDLQPAVVAHRVSPAGGVPWVRTRGAGNASDTQGCQPRAEAWIRAGTDTPTPRALVAAAQRSWADKAVHRAPRGCLPRMPATLPGVAQVMGQALPWETGPTCEDHTRSQPLAWCHSGMAQRWRVV
jgi:hypothetical protein